jgi:5-methyltetrahydrofolate--homocysteine methyltransferase
MPENLTTIITSKNKEVHINRNKPTVIIGERINPTGRKKVLAALQSGDFDTVREDALSQVEAGADILDVNAGVPGADEPSLLKQVITTVMEATDVPLCIDTANPQALEAALSIYQGKPLVNSVNGEQRSLNAVLPLVKAHHASVIALCMDDDGIPETPEARLKVADRIIDRASQLGIPLENIIADPLALTMGSDSNAGRITLETMKLITKELGVNISLGASNISFGLPDRKYINAAFLSMAIQSGLTCPITNPLVPEVIAAILAADLAMGKDDYGMRWISSYRKRQKTQKPNP